MSTSNLRDARRRFVLASLFDEARRRFVLAAFDRVAMMFLSFSFFLVSFVTFMPVRFEIRSQN